MGCIKGIQFCCALGTATWICSVALKDVQYLHVRATTATETPGGDTIAVGG